MDSRRPSRRRRSARSTTSRSSPVTDDAVYAGVGVGYSRAMRKLLFVALIGGALVWFLDPESGPQRRETALKWLADQGVVPPRTPASEQGTDVPSALATVS